ncbi:hypothetical protein TNCV_385841 [Trichonephila clavipes]|nr:hypothetical protein TNCV_385841 [Trichonephila clavipes]
MSLFTCIYTPTLFIGARFTFEAKYAKAHFERHKIFQLKKIFQGREKPQRDEGSNERLDRSNEMLDGSNEMLDRSNEMLDRSHEILDMSYEIFGERATSFQSR